jgi:hypothetical protein
MPGESAVAALRTVLRLNATAALPTDTVFVDVPVRLRKGLSARYFAG